MILTHPLRLSTGSHQAGSGRGCAMNVVSWENGDTMITDFPPCTDRMLARLVQELNDTICGHTATKDLCPPCSVTVLDLAHRTVGTSITDWPFEKRREVYARIALHAADEDASGIPRVACGARERESHTRAVLRRWLDHGDTAHAVSDLSSALLGGPVMYAVDIAQAEPRGKGSLATDAGEAVTWRLTTVEWVSEVIDLFLSLTGKRPTPVAPETTEAALAKMRVRA
jgi:hypothetical protein